MEKKYTHFSELQRTFLNRRNVKILLMFIVLAYSNIIFGQSNDCVASGAAGQLTVKSSCTPITFNSNNDSDYWNSATGCNAIDRDDAWGWFDATSTTTTITYYSTNDAVLHLFTGSCATTMTSLACADANSSGNETITYSTTVGVRYLIRIQRYNSNSTMNGTICIYSPPIITNLSTTSGCIGSSLIITGTNLTGATAANIGGTSATITGNTDTSITVTVGSGTTGKVSITNPGGTATSTGNFTVIPNNTVGIASSSPELCINTPLSAAITHTTTGATGIGLPIDLPAGVSASWSSNTITINGTPTSAGTFNYSIPLTGGCGSVTATGTITVNGNVGTPTAITIASGSEPSCQLPNGTTTTIYATTSIYNSSFNWSLSNNTAGTINATTGIMTWANGFSGTVDIQVTANGCNGPTAQIIRNITITPSVETPSAITVVSGIEPTCQLLNGTTSTSYATTAANSTGFTWSLSNGAAGSIDATTGVMTWTNGFSGTVNIQVTANGCNGPSTQVIRSVTITANNIVGVASSTPTVCINTALTDITHTTTNTTGIDTPINLPTGVTASWATGIITISGTPSVSGTFNYTIPLVDGCGNASATGTIIVENPVDAAGAISGATTVCQGQNAVGYSVAAIANATSYTWTIPSGASIITGATTNSITVNYSTSAISGDFTVSGTNECGNGIVSNYAINVNPLPAAAGNISGATAVCQGQINVIYSVGTIANATNYNWILPSGASITSGAGTNTIYVSYDMTAVSGGITVIGTNSCGNGLISETYPITVSITPSITTNYSTTICSDGTATIIPAASGGNIIPIGTTYSWGSPSVSGGVTGASPLSNQPNFAQVLSNPTNVQQTASYNVTASTNGCSASTFSVLVYINPKPTIDILTGTSNQSICSGASMVPITFYNPNAVAGTIDYNWTRETIAGVTGMGLSGTGATISGSLSNSTNVPQTIIFTVTATSEDNCSSNAFTVSVVVNPVPTVTITNSSQNICSETSITSIDINSLNGVTGTTYSWTSNNPNVTGILDGSGTTISGSLTNSTNTDQSTTFTISATANGCTINSVGTATIMVKPKPIIAVTNPATQTLCGGVAIDPILYSSNVAGTTFGWTRNTTLTGMPTNGSGNNISGTLDNFTNSNVTVTFTITATANGCTSSTTVQVIVKPKPQLSMTPASQTICSNSTFGAISVSSSNSLAGATAPFSWTRDNVSPPGFITGNSSGTGNIPNTITLVNTSSTSQTTTFTVTANANNGCSNSATATVTVDAAMIKPVIGTSQTACLVSTPNELTITTPASGGSGIYTYQWIRSTDNITYNNIPGQTNQTYQPGTIPLFGATNTYYKLVVTSGCGSVTSDFVVIQPANNGSIDTDYNNLPGNLCPGSSFTSTVTSTHFSFSAVRYGWTANAAYISPATSSIPVGSTGGSYFLGIFRDSSASIGPLTVQNNTNSNITTPVVVTPYVYNYNASGAIICTLQSYSINVTIYPKPTETITVPSATICNNSSANISVRGNVTDAATTFSWVRNVNTNVDSSQSSGTSAAISYGTAFLIPDILTNKTSTSQTVIYTITPSSNGCVGTALTVTITIAPSVTAGSISSSQTICSGSNPAAFTQTVATGLGSLTYEWQSSTTGITGSYLPITGTNNALYSPTGISVTTWYIRTATFASSGATPPVVSGVTYTANIANCFQNTTPIVITVNTVNPGSIGTNQTVCSPSVSLITLSDETAASGIGAITYQWEISTTDCNTGFSEITLDGNSAAYVVPAGLTTTTYFRRKAISTTAFPLAVKICSEYSNCVTISVNDVTGGIVGSDQTLCGNNPAAFTEITPATGSGTLTYQWQSSTTGCSNWSPISGATAFTYDALAGLLVTTYYQRITYSTLNSVICSAVSNCITVFANTVTAGTIGENKTVCYGGDPSAFTEIVAATGTNLTYQWQINTTGGAGPWFNIAGATSELYDAPGPINRDTYFQRVVKADLNGTICYAESNFITVFVNSVNASVINGDQNVCSPTDDPTAFTVTTSANGKSIPTYQWQLSTVGCSGPWTDIPGATAAAYDSPPVTQTTYFHVTVTSTLNGVSCSAFSNCVEITSFGKVWTGAAISANTDWNNGLNWAPNGVPNSTHCVIIPNVTNKPIISGTNYEAEAYSLSILANSSLQITSTNNITVTDFVNVNPSANFAIQNNASLIQVNDSAVNSGHISYTRTSRPMTRWGYVYWGSPVVENIFSQIPSQFDLKYRWQSGTLNGAWLPLSSTSQGEGFITRVKNIAPFSGGLGTINFTFNGTPGNGVINVNVDSYDATTLTSAGNTMLLSNPYPSALDAYKFLTHSNNTELGGTLFFWTSVTLYSGTGPYAYVDYASWNLSGGVGTSPASAPGNLALKPNGKIAATQGFFAQVFADGAISFNNDMRIANFNNQFFRTTNTTTSSDSADNRVWLNLYSDTTFRQMMVNYKEEATNGIDRLYDGNSLTSNEINIYSIAENQNLVIQGRALPFDQNDIVPLGYRITSAGQYSIAIDELDGLFIENQDIYLRDKLLNIDHNLKTSAYTFNSTAGTVNDRFELVYVTNTLGTNVPNANLSTFATIKDSTIKISSSELIKAISIYDISGKLINEYQLKEFTNQFTDVFNYPNGVYIAKITLDDDLIVTKKLLH